MVTLFYFAVSVRKYIDAECWIGFNVVTLRYRSSTVNRKDSSAVRSTDGKLHSAEVVNYGREDLWLCLLLLTLVSISRGGVMDPMQGLLVLCFLFTAN